MVKATVHPSTRTEWRGSNSNADRYPLHHQVFRDLRAALDAQRVAPGRADADRARAGRALWLQPDHRPARARRARPRGTHRADARPRHVRHAAAHRSRHRRHDELRRGDAAPRARPGHARRHRRASSRPARRWPPARHRRRTRRSSTSSASGSAAASRSSSSRRASRPSDFRGCSPSTSSTARCTTSSPSATRPGSSAPARRSSR